jgi:lantibiotic modifying enzyme
LSWLLAAASPDRERLWPSGRFGAATDPCAVQHGAAGVLATLVAAAPHAADPDPVRDAVRLACRWIDKRLPAEPRLLPGLLFGRSGTAWALHEAAALLGDQRLAAAALDLAARVLLERASPDVAHGVAGAGMAQLHLWRASGDRRFQRRAVACADRLLEAARRPGGQICWPIPHTLQSTLAGRTYYGYAHGTAGIGAFLLAAGAATGDTGYTRVAVEAADTLAGAAVPHDGGAYWPVSPGEQTLGSAGWCTGSAGVGTFLVRAWQVTGEPRYADLARSAAAAVHRSRGRSNLAACHGLAGGGQFLLDLASALEEPLYRCWADDLARLMAARTVRRGTRLLVPDETGLAVVADYGVGLAGALAFLVRLRHGGPAPWTVGPP